MGNLEANVELLDGGDSDHEIVKRTAVGTWKDGENDEKLEYPAINDRSTWWVTSPTEHALRAP